MTSRRYFGNVRQRESGRWQVRYRGPDGQLRPAPETFLRKSDADRYLRLIESRMSQGEWSDPNRARVLVDDYATLWIAQRPGLRPRTVDLYTWLLKRHISPKLGRIPLGKLDTALIREWRAGLLEAGVTQGMAAKAYRLLRAILNTAVNEDELLSTNPCRIKGAGLEKTQERPFLTIDQVMRLAARVPDRWRAFILLKTFASLRWGEITALTRGDVDLVTCEVRVRRQFLERSTGAVEVGPPKSRAGSRTVSFPELILPDIQRHLEKFSGSGRGGLVFCALKGQPLRRSAFNKSVKWHELVAEIGVPNLHLHDLRHTGNTLAASSGASLKDLMTRMGHDSPAAALIYQHATREADTAIAISMNNRLSVYLKPEGRS
jgi:integrase